MTIFIIIFGEKNISNWADSRSLMEITTQANDYFFKAEIKFEKFFSSKMNRGTLFKINMI